MWQFSDRYILNRGIFANFVSKIATLISAYFARVIAAGGVTEASACLSNSLNSLDSKQLLDNASLVLIPSGFEEDVLFSQVPTSGLGDLSVVRATTATRVNSAGLIEVVPRNLLTYSEQFNNAAWVKTSSTISANAAIAPNGTLTADKLIPNNGTNPTAGGFETLVQFGFLTASVYTYSVYAKAAEFTSIRFRETNFSGQILTVDLTNGAITGGGGQFNTPLATDVGNGWYRISFTSNSSTLMTNLSQYAIRCAVTGDGTSGILIWGAQVEQGSLTEYLPTVTRLNFPRLDYTNASCPSLLVEPQRTNLLLRSEELDNVIWSKTNATVTANSTTSPSGILNADKLVENTVNAQHYINQSFLNSNSLFTYSIYAKKGERDFLFINAFATIPNNFTYLPSAYFNLNNGTVGTVSNCNAFIQNVGNGWYRCIIQCTSVFPQTSLNVSFYNYIANTISNTTYLGDGTSGIFLWGAQVEVGSYSTSYIPTVAAAVTRNAETISKTGISSLIGQAEGTLFFDGVVNNIQNTFTNILSTNKSTSLSTIVLTKRASNNTFFFQQFLGNGTTAHIPMSSANSFANGVRTKIAIRYKSGDFAMYINGNLEITSTSGFTNNGVKSELFLNDSVTFFSFQESVSFNQVALYTNTLTNAELASLTTL
jgi:hypothetical protein